MLPSALSAYEHDRPEPPVISQELLDHLRAIFPLTGYRNCGNERLLYTYHGTQDVIEHLEGLRKSQVQE